MSMIRGIRPNPEGSVAEINLATKLKENGYILVVTIDEYMKYVHSGQPDPNVFVSMGGNDQRVVFKNKDIGKYYVYEDPGVGSVGNDNSIKFR